MRQRIRKTLLLISMLVFPLTIFYFSPYLVFEAGAMGIIGGSLLMFGLLFASSLFVGRLWCGWACPGGGIEEAAQPMNQRRVTSVWARRTKWLIWTPWVAGIVLTLFLAGGPNSIQPFYMTTNGISVAEPTAYIIFYIVVGLFVVLALAVGRRAACHSVCWMAPFMILGRRLSNALGLPALRLAADPDRCTQCTTCTTRCPMSLDVHTMVKSGAMEDANCILCGSCVDGCHKQAIRFTFATPSGQGASHARHDS